jgi:hypothetical protein
MDDPTVGPYGATVRHVLMPALVLAIVGVLAVAGIADVTKPVPAGWTDPAAHVVDGRWFGAETPCPLDIEQECSLALHAALDRITATETEVTVTSASVARSVGAYRDGRGGTVLATTGGWVEYRIAMLGLSDGRRVMVGVYCEPLRQSQAGSVPATCQADAGEVSAPRVGAEPWLARD